MRGSIRCAFATLLLLVGVPSVAAAPGNVHVAEVAGAQFDALIADAKATMLSNPMTAIARAKDAERYALRFPDTGRKAAVATAQWLQGEGYSRIGDNTHAAPLIDRAIASVEHDGPSELYGKLLLSRGGVKTAQADVAGALAAYQHAHDVFRIIGETRSRAVALVSIGLLYQEAKDYTVALKKYAQSIDVYAAEPPLLFSIYINRGVCFTELKQLPKAQLEFQKALDIARTLKAPVLEAQTLRNIARGELVAGHPDAADRAIAQGVAASARGGEAASARNHFLVLSAWSARLHGRLPVAQRLIARAFATDDIHSTTLDQREGHQIAYDIYKAVGDEADALIHLEALKRFDDKTSELASSANTSLAAARFDFANQELNIEKLKRVQLQRNIDDAKLRARNQQTIFGGLAVATVIIVAMLAFGLITIRRSRNEVRAANVDLENTNAALGKALAAKTEFLATTSHEIRTPLNGILGMTQVMLADQTLSAPLRDRIEVVHGAGVTMRALVDDILDVAKMETGNLTLEDVPFDLKATLRDVSRLWEEQARAKGLGFVLDLDESPDFIMGDAARLRQIAFNLLSNALKFTAAGRVTMRATATESELSIAVSDSGIGIPADKLGIIFESFRQVDAGTTRQFGGTGLGLAICRNLAQAMGGTIAVTSVLGSGSTFTLALPLRLATLRVTAVDPVAAGGALLILDRNPISRSMLRAVLETRAGRVVFAGSPDEALLRIAEGGVDRVLIDEATLKATDDVDAALAALGSSVAVSALLWSAPSDADRIRFAAAGIDQVIAKPIAGVALAALLFDSPCSDHDNAFQLVTRAA